MASPVDTSVKFALSTMAGAPTISGAAGSRISALKAFAVTGFGTKAVDAGGTISGGKCRLPFSSGASAAVPNSVITVAGATPAALNGEQKVLAVSTTWVEFATALPDGAVTGSVTFRMAPLGWEEVYTKTNVSVFRPTDPRSSRPYLRIDDTNATYAIVQMYESMSDVDTGINGTPARYWVGRSAAAATAVSWVLAGDSCGLLVGIAPYSTSAVPSTQPNAVYYFGDCVSDRSGDAYPAVLTGNTTNVVSNSDGALLTGGVSNNAYVMRQAAGLGFASLTSVGSEFLSTGVSGAAGQSVLYGSFPSRAAQALFLTRTIVADGGTFTAAGRRGVVPGVLHVPQSDVLTAYPTAGLQESGSGDYAGKMLLSLTLNSTINGAASGVGFIDVTGPWRPQL